MQSEADLSDAAARRACMCLDRPNPPKSMAAKPSRTQYVAIVCMALLKYGNWRQTWEDIVPVCDTPKNVYFSLQRLILQMPGA